VEKYGYRVHFREIKRIQRHTVNGGVPNSGGIISPCLFKHRSRTLRNRIYTLHFENDSLFSAFNTVDFFIS
jgi:hypothetical protein